MHLELPSNKAGSKARLASKLYHRSRETDDIISTQLREGIIEEVIPLMITDEKNQFFIPHKMVVKEEAETIKNRIAYDAPARAGAHSPSLNECLKVGHPLQNRI